MELSHYMDIGKMDELGRLNSPVHRLDARAQIITTLVFILVVMSYSRYEVSALIPLFLYPAMLLVLGELPVRYIGRKVAIAAPFAIFVGIFNPWLDRQVVGVVGNYEVTGGWFSLVSILLRFGLTVSAAIILVACTGIHRLCAAGLRLGLPRVFIVQLMFMYRYFFVIGDEAGRMVRGLDLRNAGGSALGLRLYGILLGQLLLRAMARAQRIYRAMVARGFEGEIHVLQPSCWSWRETAFLAGWTVFFMVARFWNLPERLGYWITGGNG